MKFDKNFLSSTAKKAVGLYHISLLIACLLLLIYLSVDRILLCGSDVDNILPWLSVYITAIVAMLALVIIIEWSFNIFCLSRSVAGLKADLANTAEERDAWESNFNGQRAEGEAADRKRQGTESKYRAVLDENQILKSKIRDMGTGINRLYERTQSATNAHVDTVEQMTALLNTHTHEFSSISIAFEKIVNERTETDSVASKILLEYWKFSGFLTFSREPEKVLPDIRVSQPCRPRDFFSVVSSYLLLTTPTNDNRAAEKVAPHFQPGNGTLLWIRRVMVDKESMELEKTSVPFLDFHFDDDEPVLVNNGLYYALIKNLVSNCVDHNPTLLSEQRSILPSRLHISQGELQLVSPVQAIAPGFRERIFERGYSTAGGEGTKTSLRGHGMYIVRMIARASGGEAAVTDHHDKKTGQLYYRFTISLGNHTRD